MYNLSSTYISANARRLFVMPFVPNIKNLAL